ncbi:MAG: hypothetical protein AMJ55_08180 [Gammaproteobacteria bacterium SG8_15]|nr:MAG: hypothetical protein AMJ55_08180 [Gammaproteobacteria bacterium SG8_15]
MINHLCRFLSFVCTLVISAPAWSAAPQLESDTDVATAGYYRLEWNANEVKDFILEESQDYYYRVRELNTQSREDGWSEVVHVQVQHHSLTRALLFFVIGAIVFVATLAAIIVGNRQASNN